MLKFILRMLHLNDDFSRVFGRFDTALLTVADIVLWMLLFTLLARAVRRPVKAAFEKKAEKTGNASRYLTVSKLCDRGIGIAAWFFGLSLVLSELGLTTTVYGLFATAGIGGIALGLGAQSLIKDVINGGFLLAEQQLAIGDYVTVANVTGTVEDISLRTTRLRAFSGELTVIPNGEITSVTNFSRGTNRALVDVPIPYGESPERVTEILHNAMQSYAKTNPDLAETPAVVGIVAYAESAVMLRIVAHCRNLQHWATERGIRAAVLSALEKENIAIPFNTVVLLHGEDEK